MLAMTRYADIAANTFALGFELALSRPTVYGLPMSRLMSLSFAVVLSLLSVVATAAPIRKRPTPVWHWLRLLARLPSAAKQQPATLRPKRCDAAFGKPRTAPLVH
jgi:hypothetical protein